jgi:hypothetical protein
VARYRKRIKKTPEYQVKIFGILKISRKFRFLKFIQRWHELYVAWRNNPGVCKHPGPWKVFRTTYVAKTTCICLLGSNSL